MVVGLLALASPTPAQSLFDVELQWTAPGDDSLTGIATQYDLRLHTRRMLEPSFMAGYRVPTPVPGPPGTQERVRISGLQPGTLYYFAIRTADERGNWSKISNVPYKLTPSTVVGVGPEPLTIGFSHPWPNPARASVNFIMTLSEPTDVLVEVFEITGRRVRTVAQGERGAGTQTLTWDLRDDAGRPQGAGVYFARAQVGGTRFVRRIVVTR